MRQLILSALLVCLTSWAAYGDTVTFTSRAAGNWNADLTWDQVPDPDPGDPGHLFPILGDTANVGHSITLTALHAASTLNFSAGTMGLGANSLSLHAPSAWTGGTFTGASGSLILGAASGLSLSGNTAKTFSAGTLLSSAAISLSAGSLVVNGSMIDQSGGGTLSISSAAAGAIFNAGTRMLGGALAGDGTVTLNGTVAFDAMSIGGLLLSIGTNDSLVLKNAIANSGTIQIQDTGAGLAVLRIDGSVSLGGAGGRIIMAGAGDNRIQSVGTADVLTIGSGQTITAVAGTTIASQIDAAVVNNGLIEADVGNLVLAVNAKTNNAVMRAINSGTLHLDGITLTNTGTISAVGISTISLDTATIIGGRIDGGGTVNVAGAATFDGSTGGALRLDNITVEMNTSDTLNVFGTITNNGLIQIRDTGGGIASLRLVGDVVLDGTGTVLFYGSDDQRITTASEANVLTLGAGQLMTTGALANADSQVNAHVTNLGIIEANQGRLVLNTYSKNNLNVMRARNGGVLEIAGIVVNNSGTITADAGSRIDLNVATIVGGRIDGTGTVEISTSAVLDGSTAAGPVRIDNAIFDINTAEILRLNGQITNNGLIQIRDTGGSVADVRLVGNLLIDGAGSILFHGADDQRISSDSDPYVLTLGAGQLVTTGTLSNADSQINTRVLNQGIIEASAGRLVLMTYAKDNANILRARNGGTLEIAGITINNTGTITAEAGSYVQLNGATIFGGRIDGTGTIDVAANDAVLDSTVSPIQTDGVAFDINVGEELRLRGGLINNATLQLRDNGSGVAYLTIDGSQTLSGSGTVLFAGGGDNYVLGVAVGDTLTVGASQTITSSTGTGPSSEVRVALLNQGVVEAVGGLLTLTTNPKTNTGIMRARGGGQLVLSGTTLDNVGAGTIHVLSDGEMVVSAGATLNTAAMHSDGLLSVNAARANVGNLTGAGAVVLSASSASQLTANHIRQGALTINTSSAKATITPNGGPSGTSRLGSISAPGSGKLDLTNNDLVIDYTGDSPIQSIRALLLKGYNSGAWNGGGIVTSMGNAVNLGLGYGEASVLFSVFPATFSGQALDSTCIAVKYTYFGDTNLDGQVDITDLGNLATNWQTSDVWTGGDLNYSGFVDITDLGLLATNWQAGVGSPLSQSFEQALQSLGLPGVGVPEPSLGMLGAGLLLLRRRGH